MATSNPVEQQWQILKDRTADAVQEHFPVESNKRRLVLNGLSYAEEKAPSGDIRSQEEAKNLKRTWGAPLYGDVSLIDKETGKEVDRTKIRLLTLPRPTNRYSYILDGSEWQVDNLWRLRSGIYAQIRQNGQLQAEFNLAKPFVRENRVYVPFDPERKLFQFKYGATTKLPLYSVLKIMGVSDEEMKKAWGKDIYQANAHDKVEKNILDFYDRRLAKRGVRAASTSFDDVAGAIVKEFDKTRLLPDTTKAALGKSFDRVTGESLLLASQKILNVARGEEAPEDRDSLVFKGLHSIDDFVHERLTHPATKKTVQAKIHNNLDRQQKIREIFASEYFDVPLRSTFTKSSLSKNPEQVNPLEMMANHRATTIIGGDEGGIKNEKSVTTSMKLINPSHLGFLDPVHTPESEKTGISLHLPLGVKKEGNEAKAIVYDLHEHKLKWIGPAEMHSNLTLLPDQVEWNESGKPKPIAGLVKMKDPKTHEIVPRPFKDARYLLVNSHQLYDEATNLIPFLQNDQGNRTMVASRQMTQAVGLANREAPMVQVKSGGKQSWEKIFGIAWSHTAHVDGKIVEIQKSKENNHPDAIILQDAEGTKHQIQLYNNFPLNDAKTFIHSTPSVAVGDEVKKGQVIADSNFTRDGHIALGTNLRVGYLPYQGYNFDDGIVISASASKKLTSEHLHRHSIDINPDKGDRLSLSAYRAYVAGTSRKFTREQAEKLGPDGIIQIGQKVAPGDVLIAAVGKNEMSGDVYKMVTRLGKHQFAVRDKSVTWDSEHSGEVVKVTKSPTGRGATVYVKTNEPAEVGDKIAGRHGNKAIITRILPDAEMPRVGSAEGRHLEVLMNPSGVPTRINLGQMLETASSKIAEKTGKPYLTQNFGGAHVDYAEKVRKELKDHGLSDTDVVYDPTTKQPLGEVLTGSQYILKLKHQVEKKLAVRSYNQGYTIDQAPRGTGAEHPGQAIGQLEFYTLLAHGARENLREMATYKSDRNLDEKMDPQAHLNFWHRVMTGQPLPTPKSTFAYKKFEALLNGLGVNVHKQGHELVLQPLTDKGVLAMSNGEIPDPGRILRGKDAKELEKGLFDPKITGGLPTDVGKGLMWSHITLAEPMPNPVFVGTKQIPGPAVILSGLKYDAFEEIAKGKAYIEGKTGGRAIENILKNIDVKAELEKTRTAMSTARGTSLDHLNRKAKYLLALDNLKLKPHEAYIVNHIPVLPPVFRPVTVMQDGSLKFDDLNGLYRSVGLINDKLKNPVKELPDGENQHLREQLYDVLKATAGLGGRPVYESNRKLKGIIDVIHGEQPKFGYFQRRLIKRRQDLSMRSTIIPEPAMGLDEVGIPRNAAMELYKPFVVREMHMRGIPPAQAMTEIKADSQMAQDALKRAMEDRPVLVKRDPVLHKFGIMAFKPRLVEGKAIQIHPLVTGGYNADFDGDSCLGALLTCTLEPPVQDSRQEADMPHSGDIISYRVLEIRDFPRLPESAVTKPSGVVEYDVPPNVYVPAYHDGKIQIRPVTKFSIHPDCEEWGVKSRNGREIVCSSDHSLALLDPETLTVIKTPPRDSLGRCFPVMRSLEEPGLYTHSHGHPVEARRVRQMVDEVSLTQDTGWFLGAIIGDGWVSDDRQLCLASGKDSSVRDRWTQLAITLSDGASVYTRSTPHEFEGKPCESFKTTLSSAALSRWVQPQIGNGAHNKHLPERFLEMPTEFRQGLFAGLLDTDGTVNWNGRGQFQCSYTTVSERLSGEVMLLSMSLGLVCNRTETENREKPVYIVSFSIRPMQEAGWLQLTTPHKQKALDELRGGREIENGRNDFVPLTDQARDELLEQLRCLGASVRPPARNPEAFSLYTVLNRREPTVTRITVFKLYEIILRAAQQTIALRHAGQDASDRPVPLSEYMTRWFSLALDSSVGWDVIEEAAATGRKVEMYDLTVPEAWTFTMANGAVVWDTMSAFLPLTEGARRESFRMFPSNNLFSSTHGGIMYSPDQESLIGLHLLSKWGKDSKKSFDNFDEALKAKEKNQLHVTDVVTIAGKKTTVGRLLIAQHMPDYMKQDKRFSDLLQNPKFELVKSDGTDPNRLGLRNLLGDFAHKDPKTFPTTVDNLKNLGNHYAYELGFSFGLKDLDVQKKVRDGILHKHDAEALKVTESKIPLEDKDRKLVDIYTRATDEMTKALKPHYRETGNKIFQMVDSQSRGNWDQFRQMNIAPMLVKDATGRTLSLPVRRSYSEGLDIGDYWTSMHGARMGTIQKVEGTSEPGRLSKEIANVLISNLIASKDCGTNAGIAMNVSEEDVHDRFLAAPVKVNGRMVAEAGSLVTPEMTALFKKHKVDRVVVRSPLKCSHGVGVCAKCFGLNENGHLHEVGTNIGVISGQALGEPATQLAMNSFHQGGVASSRGGQAADKFTRLKQLLEVPQVLPNSATLARASGKVDRVERDKATNGWNIYVNGERHFAPAQRTPMIDDKPLHAGMDVRRGQSLTDGYVNPRHLLDLTDIHTVQNYLTNELHQKVYKDERVRRRNIETVVRGLTNLTEINDPGSSHHMPGDVALRTVVEEHNRNLGPHDEPILHKPFIRAAQQVALDQHEDWMARLNFQRLRQTLLEGSAKGWKSDLHGPNPIPSYAHGAEFGKGTKEHPEYY